MGFPQFTLPYQQPPQQIMNPPGSSPLDKPGFYFVFVIMAVALLIVSGMYGIHRFRNL